MEINEDDWLAAIENGREKFEELRIERERLTNEINVTYSEMLNVYLANMNSLLREQVIHFTKNPVEAMMMQQKSLNDMYGVPAVNGLPCTTWRMRWKRRCQIAKKRIKNFLHRIVARKR
jgi:hypothetical protein